MKHKSFRKRYTRRTRRKMGTRRYAKRKMGTRRTYAKRNTKRNTKRKMGAKRTYKMRGGAVIKDMEVGTATPVGAIQDQKAAAMAANKVNGSFYGKGPQGGGSCNNDYAPCPPIGMVGPIPQVPDAFDNKLIINAAKISSQSVENSRYDNTAPKS